MPFWIQKEGARERNRELVRLALANWQAASDGLRHSEQRGEIMYGFHGPSDADWTFRAYRRKLRALEDIGSARASGITGAHRQAIRALYAGDRLSALPAPC